MTLTRLLVILLLGFILGWFSHGWWLDKTKKTILVQTNSVNSISDFKKIDRQPVNNKVINKQKSLDQQFQLAIKQENWSVAIQLLEKIGQDNPYHPKLLMLKTDILLKQQQYLTALTVLEDLYGQLQTDYTKIQLQTKILFLSKYYLAKYQSPDDRHKRIKFLTRLIYLLPEQANLHYQLGMELVSNNNLHEAMIELDFLQVHDHWQQQSKQLEKAIINAKRFSDSAVRVPLVYKNNAWVLKASIGQGELVSLLLDTGANTTLISENILPKDDKNDYLENRIPTQIQTAFGSATAHKTIIKKITISSIIDNNFTVLVVPRDKLPNNIDGLLGTDWLNRFEFSIDQINNVLLLDKRTASSLFP